MGQIILASASPRRRQLLEQIGLIFEICPAKGEERATAGEPEKVVMELAAAKAEEVAAMIGSYGRRHSELITPQDILVIGADTVVACEGRILGKPRDDEEAFSMLSQLSGRTHAVCTGVALILTEASGAVRRRTFYEKTLVTMSVMDPQEIRRYIATGDPADKAGAYGIQGKCAIYIDKIDGDYNNVVGLPVAALYRELKKMEIDLYKWQERKNL